MVDYKPLQSCCLHDCHTTDSIKQDRQLDAMDKQVEKQRLEREKEAATKEEKARKSLLVKMICK